MIHVNLLECCWNLFTGKNKQIWRIQSITKCHITPTKIQKIYTQLFQYILCTTNKYVLGVYVIIINEYVIRYNKTFIQKMHFETLEYTNMKHMSSGTKQFTVIVNILLFYLYSSDKIRYTSTTLI